MCWTCHIRDPNANLVAVRGWPHVQNGHPAPQQWRWRLRLTSCDVCQTHLEPESRDDTSEQTPSITEIHQTSRRAGKGLERAGKGLSSIYRCCNWVLLSGVHLWEIEGMKEGGIRGRRLLLRQDKKPPHVRGGSDKQRNMQLLHYWHHNAAKVPLSCIITWLWAPTRGWRPERGNTLLPLPQTAEAERDCSLKKDTIIMTHANVERMNTVDSCRLSNRHWALFIHNKAIIYNFGLTLQ